MGNGNWASRAELRDRRAAASTTRCSSTAAQPGQCPPDGLLFGPLTAAGPCPVEPPPARPRDRDDARRGGIYVLNGNGNVTAYNGAPVLRLARRFGLRLVA